jgi:membrane protein YqaA with SNARE-associated domain
MAPDFQKLPIDPPAASGPLAWWQSEQVKRIVGLAIILAITLASFWLALNPALVQRLGHWGYLGAFVISLIASATIVLPAPGLAIIIAMGPALDPVLLGIVAGVGSAIGELSGYIAGATGSALIPSEHHQRVEQLQNLTRRYGPPLLALLAAIPFPFFDFAGIVAGILRMNVPAFVLSVSIGKSIKYIFLILTGAGALQLLLNWLQW